MTAEKFTQSFGCHKAGDKGFCRLATISTENNNNIYKLGFWFEILRNNGNVMLLRIQQDFCTKKLYRETLLINRASQLHVLIDDLRQKTQNELNVFLRYSERFKTYNQLEPDINNQHA